MNFSEFLQNNIVYLDGGMGTLLQKAGMPAGELPERLNLTSPDLITTIHKAYLEAGSNVICTNTFGANSLKWNDADLETIIRAALANAERARRESSSDKPHFIALDIGPTGKLLSPLGDLDFEDAVAVFAKTVRLGVQCGADLILIETMSDIYETKAALLAAKENSSLPVIVTNAYGADGKLMTGATPEIMVALLEGMGADAIGANCSLGPKQLRGVMEELLTHASVPVVCKPNAGLPRTVNGQTVFDVAPTDFAEELFDLLQKGVRAVGGCCGTTPDYIRTLVDKTASCRPYPIIAKSQTVVTSGTRAVTFSHCPVLIGERINPTGKKRFKQALLENDMDYLLAEGLNQEEKGAHILDVNVGLPGIDETAMLQKAITELQAVTTLPLQIDTASPEAMEAALRRYNGKPMVNSVNGNRESMDAIFPLVKKYGGVAVALTLDENGIPETAQGRVEIAKRILRTAAEYGIDKKDLIFDTLAMTVSADNHAAAVTLEALHRIHTELGCHTSLGISNISFGLPNRDAVNSIFFAMALENGLSAAIMNPYSTEMQKTYYAYRALRGMDENCTEYIAVADTFVSAMPTAGSGLTRKDLTAGSELQRAIIKGLREKAGDLTAERLSQGIPPLDLVNQDVIPALDAVGKGFEQKTVYLPQLLMSAEAAKEAFARVKQTFSADSEQSSEKKAVFVLAAVHGDIHDIGKNIVRLLLENYEFDVIDLGRDVPTDKIVQTVIETHAPLVGLSALMTTTVPAMEETIQSLRLSAPWCRIVVGGAVLTQEDADRMGADKYAADAMETVRYAESVVNRS